MSNILRTGTPNQENMFDVCNIISELTEFHHIQAMDFDTKAAFKNNTSNIITAQNVLVANNSTFTLIKEDAAENKEMFALPETARFAKATAGFKSNMNVVKSIISNNRRRSYSKERGSTVIRANFGPNKYDTLKPTG